MSFLRTPTNAFFSAGVWYAPWPNLDDVSIHLSSTFSNAFRLVCTNMDFRRVMIRFLTPGTEPFRMIKSFFTSPYRTNPPRLSSQIRRHPLRIGHDTQLTE